MTTTIDNTALATERVARARAELILDQTFYGVLVSQTVPLPSRDFPTMATNGRQHYFNPDFIVGLRKNINGVEKPPQKLVLGVQAHESEHDARRHHTRRGARDPKKWNEACDYAINPDLIRAGFELPEGALLDWKYEGMSAEDIYRTRELDQQQPQQQPQDAGDEDKDDAGEQDGDETGDDAGDDQPGDDAGEQPGDEPGEDEGGDEGDASGDQPGDDATDEAGDQPGEGSGDGSDEADGQGAGEGAGEPDAGEGNGAEPAPDATGEAAGQAEQPSCGDPGQCGEVLDATDDPAERANEDAKWERVIRQAGSLARKRGDAPGHITREIERNDHPPQDWRDALRAFFDGGATTMETWSRPNRRFIGGGLYLPGRERDGVNRAAFIVDTSGSMDDIALAAVSVETQAALDEAIIDEVVVIYADTRVTRVDTYRSGDEIEFDPRGGNGTTMAPAFKYVADEIDASLIVCFTDGFIEPTAQLGPEPACPVLWAYTGYPTTVREMIANAPWGAPAIDVGSH